MKKLAEKLKKVDIELPKWTRKVLYDHIIEVCEDLKNHNKFKLGTIATN
ncbi:MAG: hypothetical protein ACFE9C_06865 [Candidatus Hodarchaeota archaeon]